MNPAPSYFATAMFMLSYGVLVNLVFYLEITVPPFATLVSKG